MSTPYTGPSVVDYLASLGQANDFNSRSALAKSKGIANYTGSADQNTQLLGLLRGAGASGGGGTTSVTPTTPVTQPSTTAPTKTPFVAPTTPVDSNDLRTQLTSGQIDGASAKQQLTERLAQQYGAKIMYGIPQWLDADAQNAYNAALKGAVTSLFSGLGDVQYGGQFGSYDENGNFAQKSTTVVKGNASIGGGTNVSTNAYLKGQPMADAGHQFGSPATGYYATQAEAANAASNVAKGVTLGENAPAGPNTQAPTGQVPAPIAPVAPGSPAPQTQAPGGQPQVDANGNPIPQATPTPTAPVAPTGGGVSTYSGPSVVDYLNSIGQPSDYASRAQMAQKMGITNYTGSAAQNSQLLTSLRTAGGGKDTSTTSAGANAGGATTPGVDTETQGILDNAKAIAASFGWVAPDPKNSPLNIAQDLFKQGLESFGLNDLKTEINKVLAQQSDLQNKQADEVAEVNANPWLTEGERVAKVNKIGDKYSTKLDILTHQQQLYEADYKTGLDQIQWQVGQAMTAYKTAQDNNDSIFKEALSIAEKQVEAKAALEKENNKTTSLSPGEVLVDSKGNTIAKGGPKTTGTGGSGGSTKQLSDGSLKFTQSDIDQGKRLLDVGDGAKNTGRGPDGYVDPYKYLDMADTWIHKGGTVTGFVKYYPPKDYINPADSGIVPAWAQPGGKSGSSSSTSLY